MANIDATRDAREELLIRFDAARIKDCFRPRRRKARGRAGDEGWYEMVCVDSSGRVITGVKSVRYRSLVTDAAPVPDVEEDQPAACGVA